MHLACEHGYRDCAEILIKAGAQVNAKSSSGDSPLFFASEFGRTLCVELLLSHSARVNEVNFDGVSIIILTAENGHHDCLKLLLQHGARVTDIDEEEETPLHKAAEGGYLDCLKLLLQNGARVNDINQNEETALHKASEEGHLDAVKVLLEAGADINLTDIEGFTPLDLSDGANKTLCSKMLTRWPKQVSQAEEKTEILRATARIKRLKDCNNSQIILSTLTDEEHEDYVMSIQVMPRTSDVLQEDLQRSQSPDFSPCKRMRP